jgi:hypothetical protein
MVVIDEKCGLGWQLAVINPRNMRNGANHIAGHADPP